MSRATLTLSSDTIRQKAINWIRQAPDWTTVTFKRNARTVDQNSRLWAMLTDVSQQVEYYGKKRTPDDWKIIFTAALQSENIEAVPGIDGRSTVFLGASTSRMTKAEHTDLMALIEAYGIAHNVVFGDQPPEQAAA